MGIKVLIIGKGLTGLVTAWQLLEQAKEKRIEIEIISDGSGASPYVHGMNIPLHPNDSVETFKTDTIQGGYGLSERYLVNSLCEESVNIPKLFEKLNVELEKKDGQFKLLKPLGSTWPRVAGSGNHTGADIMSSLMTYLRKRKEVIFTSKARVLRLDVEVGKVNGAVLWNKETEQFEYRQADAVMLASGGFCGIYPFSTNSKDSGGDGIAMAYEAGARLMDMEFIQFEPSVALYPEDVRGKGVVTTMFYEGAVLRNGKNERFMMQDAEDKKAECVGKDILAKAIYREIQEGNPTKHGGVFFDATGVGRERLMESYDSYVSRYQNVGMDITKEMFEIAPAPHTSLGGVMIQSNGETDVKGLFAGGEIIGGLHGANRVGGNAGLETMVFGKIASEGIFRYVETLEEKQKKRTDNVKSLEALLETEHQKKMDVKKIPEMRGRMEQLLEKHLFVVRNGSDLEQTVAELEKLSLFLKEHHCGEQPYEKLRLENDLTCALLLAKAAYARTESVGCHVRTDSSGESDRYHVLIQKDENGREKLWKEYVMEEK